MARREVRIRYSDLSGSTESVLKHTIAVDGTTVEIDLDDPEFHTLRVALQPYFEAGRRVGPTVPGSKPTRTAELREIRAWCAQNGLPINVRGRVPHEHEAAFHKAKAAGTTEAAAGTTEAEAAATDPADVAVDSAENHNNGGVRNPEFSAVG
jgi:hypothetical protein